MSVRVKIPTQVRVLVGGVNELDVSPTPTVGDLFRMIGQDHPELVDRIFDEEGLIRRFINVYVGDEDVRFLQGLDTPIEEGSVVSILPAVAGG
ncbi:MAG: MoaD/ThiS family protein [Actinomycetota bacterium]